MPSYGSLKSQLLELGAQDAGGDAETMAGVAINHTYRRILSLLDEELSKREFTVNTTAGAAASVTGSGTGTFAVTASSNDTLQISIDDGPSQTVTLTAGSARTAAEVVADINDDLDEGVASVSGSSVKISSSSPNSESKVSIEAVSNDAYTLLGFTAGDTRGSGGSKYGLPLYARTDINFEDAVNERSIEEITSRQFQKSYPGQTDTGDPFHYYNLGNFGVQVQPTGDGAITVVSDSASDTTTTYVTITGFSPAGLMVRETLTLNGTTGVTGSQSFKTVERIVKSSDDGIVFVGNITVTDVNSTTLAVIPIWVDSPEYVWIELYPTPDTARRYTFSAAAFKPDLVKDEDWPDVNDYFQDMLLWGAGQIVLPSFGKDDTALMFKALYDERIREYVSGVKKDPNLTQTFADVQMGRMLPRMPYIPGVHWGIAKGQ